MNYGFCEQGTLLPYESLHQRKSSLVLRWVGATHLYTFACWVAESRSKCNIALILTGSIQAGWVEMTSSRLGEPCFHARLKASLAKLAQTYADARRRSSATGPNTPTKK